ncbi:unnamed protein product [Clavelina lepadiformis]|uniref:P-type domain-containing protein n=1 Tax=Clavelina lepadiformis TaxID=159417 RepID=A0ABP0G976_CLALP
MRFICFIGVFVSVYGISTAYTATSYPSTISERNRVDCYPEAGSNQQTCRQRGCMWCETNQQGPPWCFYDTPTAMTALEEITGLERAGVRSTSFYLKWDVVSVTKYKLVVQNTGQAPPPNNLVPDSARDVTEGTDYSKTPPWGSLKFCMSI